MIITSNTLKQRRGGYNTGVNMFQAKKAFENAMVLEMLFGKGELDAGVGVFNGGLLDSLGERTRSTEVSLTKGLVCVKGTISDKRTYSDSGLELRVGTGDVLTTFHSLPDTTVDCVPIWATEHGARAEQGQGVVVGTNFIDSDIPQHIIIDLLRQVDVDTQEVGYQRWVN